MSKGVEALIVRKGRSNLINDDLLAKTKDIIIGTRQAGTAISRRVVIYSDWYRCNAV